MNNGCTRAEYASDTVVSMNRQGGAVRLSVVRNWTALLLLLGACHDRPTESAGPNANWPAVPQNYTLHLIDGVAVPAYSGPDTARYLVDSARFEFTSSSLGGYGWTLTPYVGGTSHVVVVALTTRRVAADSFVVEADVPGAPSPDIYLSVRESTLVVHWRPLTSERSLAAFVVGARNQDWTFRAR